MRIKNVLLLYKKSAYKIYFLEQRSLFNEKNRDIAKKELDRFRKAHREHYATLKCVENVLTEQGIHFTKSYRGQMLDYDSYDLVITVGGDGTFLEAARGVKNSILLGVNSSLSCSIGNFCIANIHNFKVLLQRILKEGFRTGIFHRLRLDIDQHRKTVNCLNDVLICHSNPASMNRYVLKVGRIKEEQRSSGVWISAPCGSSGAILSAGGKRLVHTAKKIQYMPRELYRGGGRTYRLTGGVLSARQSIMVTSLMRQGRIYIDGTHMEVSFPFGATAKITLSPNPIKTIDI